MRIPLLALVAAPLLATGLVACSDDSDKLIIYSGRSEELVGPILEQLEEQVDVDVEVRYADSAELAAQLLEEGDSTEADVFFSQDAGALGALANEGRLATLDEALTGSVIDGYADEEGRWVATSARARVIAYNPDQVTGDALAVLVDKAENQPYTMLSPYPGLDQPVALQSWGHQLKLSDVNDPRIDQFLTALRLNQYQHPEPGASCQEQGPGLFDQDAPPPFAPVPPASDVNGTTVLAETDPAPAG